MISLILGVISLAMSLYFYHKANISEIKNTEILCQISNKTDMLDKITTKMLEKAFDHISDSNKQLINGLMKLQKYPLPDIPDKNDYIAQTLLLYSYIVRTLFFSSVTEALMSNKQAIPFIESMSEQCNKHYKEILKRIEEINEDELKMSPYYKNYIAERNSFEEIISGKW
jgi:hypothetical protein